MNKFKFNQTYNFNWYIILWIGSLLLALYLFKTWHLNRNYIGIVENKSHLLGPQEPGKVHKLLVTVGEQVRQGQVLAILDISDLKTNLNQLQEELTNIRKLEGAQQNRFSIAIQRMSLELENEAANLSDRLSLIESKSTELAGLNTEIERLQGAEKAGLGHSRDLSDLILQRDALASYLREQSKDLKYQSQKLAKTRQSRSLIEKADMDSMAKSVFLESMEHAEVLRRQISETEYRIGLRTIVAPCDGYVTEIIARSGDAVQEFAPVLTVDEIKPGYLTVYIPEKSTVELAPGMLVEISSSRSSDFNTTGIVTFVHPGFARAGERLSFRGQIFWARKVLVELNKNHNLIPGEVVNTRIGGFAEEKDYLSVAAVASESTFTKTNPSTMNYSPIQNMHIPPSLGKQSRFEPSGVAWVPEINRYLLVSDDTGIQDANTDHAPYLFLMDENGNVEPEPVRLSGINSVNDLEAVACAGDNIFYLISSQNISKKGKRPENRESILKIKQDKGNFSVLGEVKLLSLLLQFYSRAELANLGLEKFGKDGRPILNIEGAAFYEDALYFGLKEPVTNKGAIIWKLENVNSLFETQKLKAGQLSVYGFVQLGEHKNKPAGFSDLMFDKNGILWALSTIADVDKKDQSGGFYRINTFASGGLKAEQILTFPALKPEGICLQGTERFLIVFDNDAETPSFCYTETGTL